MENLGFAKIRGHPFWPSEITGDMGGRLLVTFLGSNKTGTISMKRLRKEWLPLSQAITEKFSTPRNLKRSGFATGMKELVKNTPFTFLDDPRSQVDEEQNVSPEVDEIDFSFNHLHSETPEMIDNSDVESVLDEEPNDFHIENIADPSCQKNSSSPCPYLCRECEDFFETEKGLAGHIMDTHILKSMIENLPAKGSQSKASKTKKTKKNKKPKKKPKKNLIKTLRENELEINKKFEENMQFKDGIYQCKVCCKFVTSVLLTAKCHAFSCGAIRKKGRPPTSSKCNDCFQKFSSKKELYKHYIAAHHVVNYICSQCQKEFKIRRNYVKHIFVHNKKKSLKKKFICYYSVCEKSFHFFLDY